jgi:sigma-B regulation protein RsbU (phosphoserine phosphatase)
MEKHLLQSIQNSLLEKRQNLVHWRNHTPEAVKQVQLGSKNEQNMLAQIDTIDNTLAKVDNQTFGICKICHASVEPSVLQMDYTASICLDDLSTQEREQLESELEFVQVIQRALLPQQIPAIPGLELAVFSRPAKIVSGDYFDFYQFRNGTYGFSIADAMGHGVSASLIMSGLQSALRTLVPESDSPVEVLKRINRSFLHNVQFTTFVTTILCQFDPIPRRLSFANAGHNPPLVFHANENRVSWLNPTGAAIGLVENYDLRVSELNLSEGDIIVFYTDGVTDATNTNDESFGKDRLLEISNRNLHLDAQNLVGVIRDALFDFTEGKTLEDDITLLVCKVSSR